MSRCYVLQVDGANATADGAGPHGLAKPAYQFLAGVLAHLPALSPFLLASPNSHHRAVPSTWSGAFHVRPLNLRPPLCVARLLRWFLLEGIASPGTTDVSTRSQCCGGAWDP